MGSVKRASAGRQGRPVKPLVAIAVGLTAAACAKGVTIQQYPDLDRRVTRMDGNEIKIDRSMPNSLIINAAMVEESDSARYVLWIQMRGSAAVQPNKLTLIVDEEPPWVTEDVVVMDAHMTCPERTQAERSLGVSEVFGCVYHELYWSPVTSRQLSRIARSYQVTARLDGVRGYIERRFSAENIAAFADFVAQHVPAETSSTTSSTPSAP